MKKIKFYYLFWVAMLTFIALIGIYAFLSSQIVVIKFGAEYDYFGRPLFPTPLWARFLLFNENSYPGVFWAIFDRVLFFVLIGFCWLFYYLFKLSERKIEKFQNKDKDMEQFFKIKK